MPNGIPASKVGPLTKPVGKLKLNLPNNLNNAANGLDGSTDIVKPDHNANRAPAGNSDGAPTTNGITGPKVNGTASSREANGDGGPVRGTSAREGSGMVMMSPESINGHL
jgi:hypothetical protein